MTRPEGSSAHSGVALSRASLPDTLRIVATIVVPTVAKGVVVRRPRVMALQERLRADHRAVRLLQRLRERYGRGPLLVNILGRSVALLLSPDDVRRVLAGSPEPFAIANREKRGALSHFQPRGVLVSHGRLRAERLQLNEEVLDAEAPVHRMSDAMVSKISEEARDIGDAAAAAGSLRWNDFIAGWRRLVRRVVLGEAAREDEETTDALVALRSDADWSYLRPKRTAARERFLQRLRGYLQRTEPASLADLLSASATSAGTAPENQVPQWLFAFDPAGMATFRALALLATHRDHAQRVRDELAGRDLARPQNLPYLRACVLESVRLWPTTPVILRDSTIDTTWDDDVMADRTAVAVFTPFFHRDDRALPYADRFTPEMWLDGRVGDNPALVPFSAGPGECPGRNLVLYVSSTLLAILLERHEFRLASASPVDPGRPLPRTLNNFGLRFSVTARA